MTAAAESLVKDHGWVVTVSNAVRTSTYVSARTSIGRKAGKWAAARSATVLRHFASVDDHSCVYVRYVG